MIMVAKSQDMSLQSCVREPIIKVIDAMTDAQALEVFEIIYFLGEKGELRRCNEPTIRDLGE